MKFLFALILGFIVGLNCGCSSDEMGVLDEDGAVDAAPADSVPADSSPLDSSVADSGVPADSSGAGDGGPDAGEVDGGEPVVDAGEEVDDGCGHRHQRGCGHVWEHDPDRRVPVCPQEGG